MANLTLKQLRYFDALAREKHFGRAADRSAISQPALSMQIRDLEEELGASLIERGPRQVRLTRLGEHFFERVQVILRSVDELGELARASRSDLAGELRIGVIPTIAPYLLPQVISALDRTYPGLDLRVRETLTERLLAELNEGRIDAAIVALPVSEPGLVETPLFSEEFVLVRPTSQADQPVPQVDDLAAMKLLLLEEGHCFRDQALSFCDTARARPRDGLDGSSLTTLVQMVAAGLGITLIPEMAVPVEARSAGVATARFPGVRPGRSVGMIWRKSNPLGTQLARVAEVVQEAAGNA